MSTYKEKLRRFEFTDVLGWSYTRFSTFEECKRKYFYEYYRKHDIENRPRIDFLRQLTTVPLEVGNVSHKLINRLLQRLQKTSEEIDLEKFFEYAERRTKEICEEKTFEESYFQKRDRDDIKLEVFQKVASAMENFLKSDRLQWLFEEASASKEDWFVEHEDAKNFGECRLDNWKAFCKVDFMFPIGDELHIIDWKTGKPDYSKHSIQLKGYAGWANFQFGTDVSMIRPTVAYLLPEYSENSVTLNMYDIDEFADLIRSQTEQMYQFCEIPETNFPLPKEAFAMTPHLGFCKFCKYRELCDRA